MTPYEKQVWFYFTRGQIIGFSKKKDTTLDDLKQLLNQFNKIGPEFNIPAKDLEFKEDPSAI